MVTNYVDNKTPPTIPPPHSTKQQGFTLTLPPLPPRNIFQNNDIPLPVFSHEENLEFGAGLSLSSQKEEQANTNSAIKEGREAANIKDPMNKFFAVKGTQDEGLVVEEVKKKKATPMKFFKV
jgi:hypothetical protein